MQFDGKLSICIVTYNSADKIGTAVSSIKNHTKDLDYKLFISDNSSTDNTHDVVKAADENAVILQNGDNIGFGKAHNAVIEHINTKYHAIVNPDIEVTSDVLSDICAFLDDHPEISLVVPKILFPDGSEQILPKRVPKLKYLFGRRLSFMKKFADEYTRCNEVFTEPTEIDFCTGCFFVIRSEVFRKIGGFDDRFFMYMEDADLCKRVNEVSKLMYCPDATVVHKWERGSHKNKKLFIIHVKSMIAYFCKWGIH
jgi:GT2 family glycosyltransferase